MARKSRCEGEVTPPLAVFGVQLPPSHSQVSLREPEWLLPPKRTVLPRADSETRARRLRCGGEPEAPLVVFWVQVVPSHSQVSLRLPALPCPAKRTVLPRAE